MDMNDNRCDSTLVVGADSDIGAALVDRLSGDIIAHYFAAIDNLSAPNTDKRKLFPVFGDLSSIEGIETFLGEVKRLGKIISRIVHLPSPPPTPMRLSKFDPERFQRELNIQVLSAAMIFRDFLPPMAKSGFGRVAVVLTSYCIGAPPKFLSSYVSAKYALLGLMKAASVEYADKGVTINAVAPSMTETKFLSALPDFEIEASAKVNPMGRNARPDDIAPVLELLLDPNTSFMTGAIIPITGGSALL